VNSKGVKTHHVNSKGVRKLQRSYKYGKYSPLRVIRGRFELEFLVLGEG
jgi:hypothetical protein